MSELHRKIGNKTNTVINFPVTMEIKQKDRVTKFPKMNPKEIQIVVTVRENTKTIIAILTIR